MGDPQTGKELHCRGFSKRVKVLSPTSGFPGWVSGNGKRSPQRIWLWRSVGFDRKTEERETPLLKVTHKVSYTSGTRGESSGFISAWAWVRPTCWYRRFSCKVGGGGRHSCGSLWGQRHWLQEFWGILSGMSTPGSHRFLTKIRLVPTAYKLQCWDASGQTSNQGRSIADRLLKVLVSSQLSTKHSPWQSPAYQRDTTQLHSPAGRNQSFPPASLYNSCIHHGAESRNKNYNPAT